MRTYTVVFSAVNVTASQDLFEITNSATEVLALYSAMVGQTSDTGESQSEILRCQIVRIGGAAGSGGSAATPRKHEDGDPAANFTAVTNNTTLAQTPTVLWDEPWNVQSGWPYNPIPEERITIPPSGILVVRLLPNPADPLTMSGRLTLVSVG
jgi:hypothetical protein